MDDPIFPISKNDRFTFSCNHRVACFNDCCQDLNQYLTPYDILRAKQHLGLPSSEFLSRYTCSHTGQASGLPVITLKTSPGAGVTCPFVKKEGCLIYNNRPASCRLYPLARALSRDRKSGQVTEQYFLIKEDHCGGFGSGKSWTVTEWLDDQGLHIYNEMNDKMMEIIHLKNCLMPGPLDTKSAHLCHMALYDLDSFRHQIVEKGILGDNLPASDILEPVRSDDTALLNFAMTWIQQVLFSKGGRE
ncbi:MAG: YkgJ family cysteine cluster protein [Desulfobacterales bacterium]|jgi:Fe-S-cluster containining protein|nr:YkgJ family cysteine cluster protein [Desulfobacterales bacterium]